MQTSDRSGAMLSSHPLERRGAFRGDLAAEKTPGDLAVLDAAAPLSLASSPIRRKRLSAVQVIDEAMPIATPKARNQPVVKLIADHRARNLCSEEETAIELYHSNLSVHQLTILVSQLWGENLGLSAIAKRYSQVVAGIEAWRARPITTTYPYVFLASIDLKCSCGLEKKQATVLMAEGVNENGDREVLGVAEATDHVGLSWCTFLQDLKARGLGGVRLFIGDRGAGVAERLEMTFPGMHFQASVVQFRNEVLARVPTKHLLEVQDQLGLIDEATDWPSARKFAARMFAVLKRLKLTEAAKFYGTHVEETLNYLAMPGEHWRGLRSNSGQAKILRSLRERTRMVGAFSDGLSAVYLVSARLRHIEAKVWSEKRYLWKRL